MHTVGLIGVGDIFRKGHLPGIKGVGDRARIKFVFARTRASAELAARDAGAETAHSVEDILRDKEVDVVGILTPPGAHEAFARRAAEAGKHLMIEKPLARTLAQARAITTAVRAADVRCAVPFMRTVDRGPRAVIELIASGELGRAVSIVHVSLGAPYGWVPLDHWMHDEEISGGPIFDNSIHFMDLARAIFGEAEEVTYFGARATGRVKSDDHATVLIRYASGATGQFTKTWNFPPGTPPHRCLHIVCEKGVVSLGPTIEIKTPAGVRELKVEAENGRAASWANLLDAIEGKAKVWSSEMDGLRMNEVLDAMEKSRAQGGAVKVERMA